MNPLPPLMGIFLFMLPPLLAAQNLSPASRRNVQFTDLMNGYSISRPPGVLQGDIYLNESWSHISFTLYEKNQVIDGYYARYNIYFNEIDFQPRPIDYGILKTKKVATIEIEEDLHLTKIDREYKEDVRQAKSLQEEIDKAIDNKDFQTLTSLSSALLSLRLRVAGRNRIQSLISAEKIVTRTDSILLERIGQLLQGLNEVNETRNVQALAGTYIKSFVFMDSLSHVFVNASDFRLEGVPLQGFLETLVPGPAPLFKYHYLVVKDPDYNPAVNAGSRDTRITKYFKIYYALGKELMEVKGKKKLLDSFGGKADEVEKFIKINNVYISDSDDLFKIFEYYNSLLDK